MVAPKLMLQSPDPVLMDDLGWRTPGQLELLQTDHPRKIVRGLRRCGKTTVAALVAIEAFERGHFVLYASPHDTELFWQEVRRRLRGHNSFEHDGSRIAFRTDGSPGYIKAKVAWNPDTLRGNPDIFWGRSLTADFTFLILDEFQNMDKNTWTEVGDRELAKHDKAPALIYYYENKQFVPKTIPRSGAVLLYTDNGQETYANQLYRMVSGRSNFRMASQEWQITYPWRAINLAKNQENPYIGGTAW